MAWSWAVVAPKRVGMTCRLSARHSRIVFLLHTILDPHQVSLAACHLALFSAPYHTLKIVTTLPCPRRGLGEPRLRPSGRNLPRSAKYERNVRKQTWSDESPRCASTVVPSHSGCSSIRLISLRAQVVLPAHVGILTTWSTPSSGQPTAERLSVQWTLLFPLLQGP